MKSYAKNKGNTLLPHLRIAYSPSYDMFVRDLEGKRYVWNATTLKNNRNYAKMLQRRWNKIEKKVMKALSEVSGLKWQEAVISCYILEGIRSFSNPMTMRFPKTWKYEKYDMLHELVHLLDIQNPNAIDVKKLRMQFGGELVSVVNHIAIHAIIKLVFLRLFGTAETYDYIKRMSEKRGEGRSWQIVENYGAERIIADFITPCSGMTR